MDQDDGWRRSPAWLAGSGIVQGVIMGLVFAYLTTVMVLNAVARTRTTTANGWSVIRDVGRPGNGLLVPVTIAIMALFAWVIYRRGADGGLQGIVVLAAAAFVVGAIGTVAFLCFWPLITVGGFKRLLTKRGLGGGPIPVNTLYAASESPSQSAAGGGVLATGTDSVLYVGGWLDTRQGPHVLHVPKMGDRYYSLQLTDPTSGANFAYVGTRATGTAAGKFLLCGQTWSGNTPDGMTRIDVPHRSALVIGRVFAADEDDRRTAYALATQILLSPLPSGPRAAGGTAQ